MIVSSDIERLQKLEDKERQLLLELMWALARETEISAKNAEDEVLKETERLENIERKVLSKTIYAIISQCLHDNYLTFRDAFRINSTQLYLTKCNII